MIEEPEFSDQPEPAMRVSPRGDQLFVVVPTIPRNADPASVREVQKLLIDDLIQSEGIADYTLWYYTPMALSFSRHLEPARVIYDCMDELSAFKDAPPEMADLEEELFALADHVFTGGQSLYERKRGKHASIYPFPSSIDHAHFSAARSLSGKDDQPDDQRNLPRPRIGFFGVVDERLDIPLLEQAAKVRPEWQFVVIGPVVKIDPGSLPKLPNVRFLGMKPYADLPKYLAGWDVAMMPFAMNESTRYISPTKTPEYLAAGKPVVSTPIRDVVRPYGELGLVHIANDSAEFVREIELALPERRSLQWLQRVDDFLSRTSWDETWLRMAELERSMPNRSVGRARAARSAD